MKKLLALLLVLAMVISMVACGTSKEKDDDEEKEKSSESATDESTEDTSSEVESESEEQKETEIESESEEVTESETESETEEATEEESEEATEPDEEVSVSGGVLSGILGKQSDNVYENELLGIGIELDSDWTVYDQDQIAELLGVASDMISDEGIAELVEESGSAYLFYAVKYDGASIGIALQSGDMYGDDLSEETYVEMMITLMDGMLESAGYENMTITSDVIEFGGEDHHAIAIEADLYGVKIYEVVVPLVYEGYIALVTVASQENNCEDILAEFYALQ